jgi:hypothetical protein
VNFRSTKVDAGNLKHKYLNQPMSTLAANVLSMMITKNNYGKMNYKPLSLHIMNNRAR